MTPTPSPSNHIIASGLQRAAAFLNKRQWRDAEQVLTQLLPNQSANAEVLRLLGIACHQLGKHTHALEHFSQALTLQPDNAVLHLNIGSCYNTLGDISAAEGSFSHALSLDRSMHAGWFNLGRLKLASAYPAEAVQLFRKALQLKPDYWQAAMCLGHALKATGDLPSSAAAYRKGIQHQPGSGDLWWSLSNIKTISFHDHEVQRMQQLVQQPGPAHQHTGIHFALGMAHEARQEYASAFKHFQKGNQLKRKTVEYDATSKAQLGQRLINTFSQSLIDQHKSGGCQSNAPIFIISLPRSGSTLVEQILASHPEVNGASELPDLGQLAMSVLSDDNDIDWSPEKIQNLNTQQLTKLGEKYTQSTQRWCTDHQHFTDKMPNNFPLVGLIALILPQAKIINCRRNPVDTGLSCYRQLFARGHNWSYDLNDIAAHYRYYNSISNHWQQLLSTQYLEVNYEDLLADQRGITEAILSFCNLPWNDDCMQFFNSKRVVRTASAGQVRQKLNSKAMNRWHQYADFINPLLELQSQTGNNRG